MATAIDIGDETDIHPTNKQGVAHRLALAAFKVAYGEDVVASGPTFSGMKVEGNRILPDCDDIGLKQANANGYCLHRIQRILAGKESHAPIGAALRQANECCLDDVGEWHIGCDCSAHHVRDHEISGGQSIRIKITNRIDQLNDHISNYADYRGSRSKLDLMRWGRNNHNRSTSER